MGLRATLRAHSQQRAPQTRGPSEEAGASREIHRQHAGAGKRHLSTLAGREGDTGREREKLNEREKERDPCRCVLHDVYVCICTYVCIDEDISMRFCACVYIRPVIYGGGFLLFLFVTLATLHNASKALWNRIHIEREGFFE